MNLYKILALYYILDLKEDQEIIEYKIKTKIKLIKFKQY